MRCKKMYKKNIDETLDVKDQYDIIASKLDFEEEKKEGNYFMKKGVIALTAVCAVAFIGGTVGGIFLSKKANEAQAAAYVTMDVNPSLSFCVNEKNKVISVSGENDEGKMIIYGEKFVGKDIEDAIKLAVKIENETGYLVSGNATIDQNNITISISADNENIKNTIEKNVNESVDKVCKDLNIDEKIAFVDSYTHEEMVELAMACDSTLTKEKADEMTYSQLVAVISLYHLETAELYSTELEDLYNQAKAYEIKLADSQFTKDTISSISSAYSSVYTVAMNLYQGIVDTLKQNINDLNNLRYNLFVDENSTYQTYLESFRQDKADVIELKNQIAAIESDSPALDALEVALQAKITILEGVETSMESTKAVSEASINQAINTINTILDQLDETVKKLPDNATIENELNGKAKELDKTLNKTKTQFFAKFEDNYSDDIKKAKEDVASYKETLKQKVAGSNN